MLEAAHRGFAGEHAAQHAGEIVVVARTRQHPRQHTVAGLGEEAALDRDAGHAEQVGAVGLGEDGGDGLVEAPAQLPVAMQRQHQPRQPVGHRRRLVRIGDDVPLGRTVPGPGDQLGEGVDPSGQAIGLAQAFEQVAEDVGGGGHDQNFDTVPMSTSMANTLTSPGWMAAVAGL